VTGIAAAREVLSKGSKGQVSLMLVSSENYSRYTLELIKLLMNEMKMRGVYLTVNKPYKQLIQGLSKIGVDTDKILFIDCITKLAVDEPSPNEKIIFAGSPGNLTQMGMAINQASMKLKESNERGFLFFDSMSTLLLYNETKTVAKFAHFLVTRLRVLELDGIVFAVEKDMDREVIRALAQFCDNMVNLD